MKKIKVLFFLGMFCFLTSGLLHVAKVNCASAAVNDEDEEYEYFSFPEPDYVDDFEAKTIKNSKSTKKEAKWTHSYQRKDDEGTLFAKTWQVDGNNNLRTILLQYKGEWDGTPTGFNLYTEKQDKVIERKIRWSSKAKKALKLSNYEDYSIEALWYDSDAHYLYTVIAHYSDDPNGKDDGYGKERMSKSTLYVINTKGNIVSQISMEDNLLLDKMDYYQFCPGFYVNFLEKKGDMIYMSYQDASRTGVFIYDAKKKCFVKQVIAGGYVYGILDSKKDQLVMVSHGKLALCNISAGDTYELEKGSKLTIAKTEITKVYQLPDHIDVSVKDDYIYMLTDKNYLRFKPGQDKWEALATVSGINTDDEEPYYQDFIAVDKTHFAVVYYDEWYGYYVDSYKIK